MRRLVIAGLFLLGSTIVYGVQSNGLGNAATSKLSITPRTIAVINLLTPDTTGQIVTCSDCAYSALCVSTGADSGRIGAWVVISTNPVDHCH